MAITWFSQSSPLKVYEDGKVQGRAYGNFTNYNGVSARQYSHQQDAKPGGDGIYVETSFRFYEPCGDGSKTEWCFVGKKQTTNTTSGAWKSYYTAKYLSGDSEKARAETKICENHGFWFDPCSATVTRTFTY